MRRRSLVWVLPILFLGVTELHAGWEMVTPFGTRQDLNAVAFGNGKYVVGGAGLFLYSTNNGGRWWKAAFNGNPSIKKIAFGNNTFVAVGSGVGYRSSDGTRWETSADSVEANDLAFGNGVFVAPGNGSIAYSTNGAAWTVVSNVAPHPIRLMSFGNGKFLGVASESIHQLSTNLLIVTSSDGIKWESEVFELVTPLRIRVPAPGRYVVYSTGLSGPPAAKTWIERDVLELTEEATWTETIVEDAWIYVVNRE